MRLTLLIFISILFAQEEKQTIAILDFSSNGVSQSEVNALTDRLRSELFRLDTFAIFERGKMMEIIKEQGFQQAVCDNSDCAVEIGKIIGVKKIITGSINKVGNLYSVSTRIINIETGQIEKVTDYDYDGEIINIMKSGMKTVAKQLVGKELDYKDKRSKPWIHIGNKKKDD